MSKDKKRTLDEAMAALNKEAGEDEADAVADNEETTDDLLSTEGEAEPSALDSKAEDDDSLDPEAIPPWICFPESPKWKVPPNKQIAFMRFRAALTDTPQLGDRVCILWGLSANEEKLATKRTRNDSTQVLPEMSKGIVRAFGLLPSDASGNNKFVSTVPMHAADWTGSFGAGNVDRFWNEIGPKCRVMISNFYYRTHSMNQEETADFFLNCCSVRSAAAG